MRIDRDALRGRQASYLADHYLATHMTAVSIALGMAGLAAASLLGPSSQFHGYQPVLWLLWVISLLAVAAAYAGTMVGSIMLPGLVPLMIDLLLPLLLVLSEFVLFAVLAFHFTQLSQRGVFASWWFAIAAFGLVTFGTVFRAYGLIRAADYADDARPIAAQYLRRLRGDIRATAMLFVFGVLGGVVQLLYGRSGGHWLERFSLRSVDFVLAAPIAIMVVGALIGHGRTASQLQRDIGTRLEP